MPTQRLSVIPEAVLALVESRHGRVLRAEALSAGLNSEVAARIHTAGATVFVKGLREEHRRVWTQQREADVAPHVHGIAPSLLWHIQEGGWDLLGFEAAAGRHADYSPGSPDLPLVADVMTRLGTRQAPEIHLRDMSDRMKEHTDTPQLFDGDRLLHTDWFSTNVLVADRALLVDWAWASRGAGWIDPALWAVWLIKHGHTPAQAEQWAARVPAWASAPLHGLSAFATATVHVWAEITAVDPDPWALGMLSAARRWEKHRRS